MAELVLTSHLHWMPVVSLDVKRRVGVVKKVLVSAKDGKVFGLLVSVGVFARPKVLAIDDIYSVEKEAVIMKKVDSLMEIDDVVRVKNLWREKAFLGNNLVLSQSGKRIGRLADMTISLVHAKLARLHVRGLWRDRIISARNILQVKKGKIIINDKAKKIVAGLFEYSKYKLGSFWQS